MIERVKMSLNNDKDGYNPVQKPISSSKIYLKIIYICKSLTHKCTIYNAFFEPDKSFMRN